MSAQTIAQPITRSHLVPSAMPTIKDVARRAHVSTTTVSHVVNGSRFVTAETSSRVRAAIDALHYQPNAVARSLRRGKTYCIGLILPDSANPFFAEIGREIEVAAFRRGYNVILCNSEGDLEHEQRYIDVLLRNQVDGLIFVASGDRATSLRKVAQRELPVVVIDREVNEREADAVLSDNQSGGYLATRHLISLGHRRIGCIAGPSNITPSSQRLTGYRQALADAGLPRPTSLIRRGDFHPVSGRNATLALLAIAHPPSAIFCCNDLMAVGALRAAAEASLRVPHDLAIVGFDNIELSSFTSPPLTTVAQPKKKMGRLAVERIVAHIQGKDHSTRREVLPVTLIVRGSCGAQA